MISDLGCCWRWLDAVIFVHFSRQPQINKAAAVLEVEWSLLRQEMLSVCVACFVLNIGTCFLLSLLTNLYESIYLLIKTSLGNAPYIWDHGGKLCGCLFLVFFLFFFSPPELFLVSYVYEQLWILMSVSFKVSFNSSFIRLVSEYLERNGNGQDTFQNAIEKGLALLSSAVSGLCVMCCTGTLSSWW